MGKNVEDIIVSDFYRDIRRLIEETRCTVALTVNAAMTMLYWQIGKRINEEVLKGKRARYGEEIVSSLSRQLIHEYGSGFSAKNIRHMMKFADVFPEEQIVSTLWRQLSWSHFQQTTYTCIKQNFFLTYQTNRDILFLAYPPSLCFACSILAGFSFSGRRLT